jgi:hypothetical protein
MSIELTTEKYKILVSVPQKKHDLNIRFPFKKMTEDVIIR